MYSGKHRERVDDFETVEYERITVEVEQEGHQVYTCCAARDMEFELSGGCHEHFVEHRLKAFLENIIR